MTNNGIDLNPDVQSRRVLEFVPPPGSAVPGSTARPGASGAEILHLAALALDPKLQASDHSIYAAFASEHMQRREPVPQRPQPQPQLQQVQPGPQLPAEPAFELPPFERELFNSAELEARRHSFDTSEGRNKCIHAMSFVAQGIHTMRHVVRQVVEQGARDASQSMPLRPDRGLNNHRARKENGLARDNMAKKYQAEVLAQPDELYQPLCRHIAPQIEFMVQHIELGMHEQNDAEKAGQLRGLWERVKPMLTSLDPTRIVDICQSNACSDFLDMITRCVADECLPVAQDIPAFLANPGRYPEMQNTEGLMKRLMQEIAWIKGAIQSVDTSTEKAWITRTCDARSACLQVAKRMQVVAKDVLATMATLYPKVKIDTDGPEQQLANAVKELKKSPSENDVAADSEVTLEGVRDALENATLALQNMVLAAGLIVRDMPVPEFDEIDQTLARQAAKEAKAEQAAQNRSGRHRRAPAAPVAQAAEFENQEIDEVPLDLDPDEDREVGQEQEARPGEAGRTGGARNRGPASRPDAGAAALQAAAPRTAPVAAAANWPVPVFQRIPLAGTAAVLNTMRGRGQYADTQVLGDIASRMMTSELNRMDQPAREALVNSLCPHLQECTRNSRAMTFPALLSFMRLSTSQPQHISRWFGAHVVDNFRVKGDGASEQAAFRASLLKGEVMELMQQTRGLWRNDAHRMFERLNSFFELLEPPIQPGEFLRALDQRMKVPAPGPSSRPVDVQQKAQVSLGRLYAGLAAQAAAFSPCCELLDSITSLHGRELPQEVLDSVDPDVWRAHGLAVFKGSEDAFPFNLHLKEGKRARQVDVNVHDVGIPVLRGLLTQHLTRRTDGGGLEARPLRLVVGGDNHPPLGAKSLRREIETTVALHPEWVVSFAPNGVTATVSRRDSNRQAAAARR